MNDGSLNRLLAELDAELARQADTKPLAGAVLERVGRHAPGLVSRYAASIDLRRLGLTSHISWG